MINQKTLLGHGLFLSDADIAILNDKDGFLVHNARSNMNNQVGYNQQLAKFKNVALGTDGAASNNDLDMFGEMQTAAMLAKAVSGDATALNAFQAIKMATLNGAKAIGLDHQLGSLKPGKFADMIAIDLSEVNTQPVYNFISHIVYALNSRQVTDVWVAGKQLLKNSQFFGLDQTEIIAKAQEWQRKIKDSKPRA